ncbi:MAG: GSCFA domain-containing protein, partial [Proteobacteria bacterium]|nr:GSCFA domain-containing protein [Pseudomonadota bacterium]
MQETPRLFQDTAPYLRELIDIPQVPLLSRSTNSLCMLGSCFTWHLHNEALRGLGINSLFQWRTGFHFSTESLSNLLQRIAQETPHGEDDLYHYPDEIGGFRPFRYYFNQRFPVEQKEAVLAQLASLDAQCVASIRNCSTLLLVTGTPRVVRLKKNGQCVTVTAKMPAADYEHKRNSAEEEAGHLERFVAAVRQIRGGHLPTMVFMLSPMRYMFHPLCAETFDGGREQRERLGSPYVEDNLGKAILRVGLQTFLDKHTDEGFHYFPGYEVVMDEMRSHEAFCGSHAEVPHFPHVSHYVAKRFLGTYVAPKLVGQIESAATLNLLCQDIQATQMPGQVRILLENFVTNLLPRIVEQIGGDMPNAALLRAVLLLLGSATQHAPEQALACLQTLRQAVAQWPTVAIWGTGGNYQSVFSQTVQAFKEEMDFVLTDGNP